MSGGSADPPDLQATPSLPSDTHPTVSNKRSGPNNCDDIINMQGYKFSDCFIIAIEELVNQSKM